MQVFSSPRASCLTYFCLAAFIFHIKVKTIEKAAHFRNKRFRINQESSTLYIEKREKNERQQPTAILVGLIYIAEHMCFE